MASTPHDSAGGHTTIPVHPWNPARAEVLDETESGESPAIQVRHDAHPFTAPWPDNGNLQTLFDIADVYIEKLAALDPPIQFLGPLQTTQPGRLWLQDPQDPRSSYWVERYADPDAPVHPADGSPHERTAVLLASLAWENGTALMGGQGLRILAHIVNPGQQATVRIVGVTSTLPSQELIQVFLQQWGDEAPTAVRNFQQQVSGPFDSAVEPGVTITRAPSRILAAHTGVGMLLRFKTTTATAPPRESVAVQGTSHAYQGFLGFACNGSLSYWPVSHQPLVTFATEPAIAPETDVSVLAPALVTATARVYAQDPASRAGPARQHEVRPRRNRNVLNGQRSPVDLGLLPQGTHQGTVRLATADFIVHNSRLVDPPDDEKDEKDVPANSDAPVTSNEFAAVNAFFHTSEFFGRMRKAGIRPQAYFRFVDLPLDVRYRASILPGLGDGQGTNAQVRLTLTRGASEGTVHRNLELRFGLGDLSRATGRRPANLRDAVERAPLGVASDQRWCWHEFGHVLIAASVGELELPFAHSVGDALAAIVCDPASKLACGDDGAAANQGGWRGVTFPWISIPRRHDRDVRRGWAWCGPMGGGGAWQGLAGSHGYQAEQVLSTSLFRLYRALGGDTTQANGTRRVPEEDARRAAADYSVYLIMRGIALLGPAAVTPCNNARMFVDALCKADIFTTTAPGPGGYVGGTAHKVVQWAFERQGLYGVPSQNTDIMDPEDSNNGTGVDLDIEDRRSRSDGPYTPVDFSGDQWHSTADAIAVTVVPSVSGRARHIRVVVRNRGSQEATGVSVHVRFARMVDGVPRYPDPAWQNVMTNSLASVPAHDGATPGETLFGPFDWEPAHSGTYAILVDATCALDRSNLDPTANYPCTTVAGPTELLVAFDNNLGLVLVTV